MTTTIDTTAPAGPHAIPNREPGERGLSFAWNVGEPDKGQQPQAELSVYYFKGTGYTARVKERTETRHELGVSHLYRDIMGRPGALIVERGASRFSAKVLVSFAEEAVARLRELYDAADASVMPFFDPTSECHTAR